jgi:hypothetical protein
VVVVVVVVVVVGGMAALIHASIIHNYCKNCKGVSKQN